MKLSNEEIAAKDLRVGNRLNKDGIVVCIDARSILDISYNDSEACKYKPIPLTPDILERCGFEMNKYPKITTLNARTDNDGYTYNWTLKIPRNENYNHKGRIEVVRWGEENEPMWLVCGDFRIKLTYVHVFQNAIYALTGEELDLGIAISKNEVK